MIEAIFIGLIVGFVFTFGSFTSVATALQITFREGVKAGFIGGMGQTTAQILWCSIAVGAVSLGTELLKKQIQEYRLLGAVILCVVAFKIFFTAKKEPKKISTNKLTKTLDPFLTVFGVAISTPGRILGYIALFVLLANPLIASADFSTKVVLVIASTLGTVLWWIGFALIMSRLNIAPSHNQLCWLQRVIAMMLVGLAGGFCFYPLG